METAIRAICVCSLVLAASAVDVSAKSFGIKVFGEVDAEGDIRLGASTTDVGCGVWSSPSLPEASSRFFSRGDLAAVVAEELAGAVDGWRGVRARAIGSVIHFEEMPDDWFLYLSSSEMATCPDGSWLQVEGCTVHNVQNGGAPCDETQTHDGGLSFYQCYTGPIDLNSPRFDSSWQRRFQAEPQTLLLEINAIDDVPSTGPGQEVKITLDGRTRDNVHTFSADLLWGENNNMFRVQSLTIPQETDIVRLTFRQDHCGPGCPRYPDEDRNAHIDWLKVDGITIEGEDFDRTGAHPYGCGRDILCDPLPEAAVELVTCGNENDWVEYDIYRTTAIEERTWGSIKAVYRD